MHPGSVVVVPMVSADEVCLVEVVRVAVGETLVELPAGTLDRDEPPAATAARELSEETGYRAARIEPAGEFWMSPASSANECTCLWPTTYVPGEQALEPGELIQTRVVPWAEAVAMCLDGRISDAKSVAGILLTAPARAAETAFGAGQSQSRHVRYVGSAFCERLRRGGSPAARGNCRLAVGQRVAFEQKQHAPHEAGQHGAQPPQQRDGDARLGRNAVAASRNSRAFSRTPNPPMLIGSTIAKATSGTTDIQTRGGCSTPSARATSATASTPPSWTMKLQPTAKSTRLGRRR